MYYISHRGNLEKKNVDLENSINGIEKCLMLGLDVEIDIWVVDGYYYLGHDKPSYSISESFLENNKLWCHAKNKEALFCMNQNEKIHYFWHNSDNYTLTSRGHIWAYPNQPINKQTIAVLPEIANYSTNDLKNCLGICSDQILRYINA